MPNLLVAPISPTSVAAELYADSEQGYYADGAYTAVPNITTLKTGSVENEDLDPQEAYYASLCSRFTTLSFTLRATAPFVTAQTTATEQAHTFTSSPAKWRRCLLHTQPTMLLLNQLRQEDVVQGLGILETLLTTVNLQRQESIGTWAWGLLARCREIGEMVSEEVGVLRDLGKKAIGVIRSVKAEMKQDENNGGDEMLGDGGNGDDEDEEDYDEAAAGDEGFALNTLSACYEDEAPASTRISTSFANGGATDSTGSATLPSESAHDPLAPARQRVLDLLGPAPPTSGCSDTAIANPDTSEANHQTSETPEHHQREQDDDDSDETSFRVRGTLDMIITIVGEFYGQRDLLNGRLLWDEIE